MKKILLATLLLISTGIVVATTSTVRNARVEAPAKVTPADPSDIKLSFGYDAGAPAIFISFRAPSTEKSYFGDGAPLTQNIDRIELQRRNSDTWGERWETVNTFTDVTPGVTLSYTDKGIEEGKNYEYMPVAYIGDENSSTYNYESVYAGIKPAKPTIKAESFKGSAPVTVTVTAPTKLEDGGTLDQNLTSIEIKRTIGYGDEVLVHTFTAPTKGETYSWTDEDYKNLTDGSSVSYYAYAKIGNFSSDAASAYITLKRDVPASPETVTAEEVEDGVRVSWTPVSKGAYGYWFDPATVKYTVYRVTSSGAETQLATDLTECVYIDDLQDITSRNSFCWKVTAYNDEGEGYGQTSDYLMEGPLPSLPLVETFNTPGSYSPTADNLWTSEALDGGYYKFEVDNSVMLWISGYYDTYIYGYGNDDNSDSNSGFLSVDGSSYSKTEAAYTSGELSRGNDKKAEVSFMYYSIPQSKSILYVELINPAEKDPDDAVTPLATLSMNGTELGWTKHTIENVDISDLETFQLRFRSLTDPDDGRNGIITPICIDNISMTATESGTTGISSISGSVIATEYYTLDGVRIANPSRGQLVIKVQRLESGKAATSKVLY